MMSSQGIASTGYQEKFYFNPGDAGFKVPLVALNRIGKEVTRTERGKSEITFCGNSFIAGPMGEIVTSANEREEAVLVAEFDLANIKRKRHSWGIFLDRRPDLYKVLLDVPSKYHIERRE